MKLLVTGGCRSGKSRYAQARAEAMAPQRRYVATAEVRDAEMADRVSRHQQDRGAGWTTIEAPLDLASTLVDDGVVLIDCLTLWLSNLLHVRGPEADLEPDLLRLLGALEATPCDVVLVTNEVGMGIVPMNALARRFRDEAGRLSQRVGAVCDEVVLCAAGLPLRLK